MSRARRLLRRAALAGAVVLGAAIVTGILAWMRLRASLPPLDGEVPVRGLSAPVRIERDRLGIPTIRAWSRVDLGFATGFVHAQDRFFQMDLMRRRSAGTLAELIGRDMLEADREVRVHGFREVAGRVVARAGRSERAVLEAYTAGVNAGLESLRANPPEYLALRIEPVPWREEDTVLTLLAMFLLLQGEAAEREARLGELKQGLPARLFAFLAPAGTEWDAPLDGSALEEAPLPGPEVIDLRRKDEGGNESPASGRTQRRDPQHQRSLVRPDGPAGRGCVPRQAAGKARRRSSEEGPGPRAWSGRVDWNGPFLLPELGRHTMAFDDPASLGSNNWAVAGARTGDGRALLANDMHLPLAVPNIWYRASFRWSEPEENLHAPDGEERLDPDADHGELPSAGQAPGVADERTIHPADGLRRLPGTRPAPGSGSRMHNAQGVGRNLAERIVTGATLPGTPAMVVGSNGHVAWGFTNSEGDWSDLVVVEEDLPGATYRTPGGSRRFERHTERIGIKGGGAEESEVLSTIWGPVVMRDRRGRGLALRWVAHETEAVNLGLLEIERARTVEQALELGGRAGIPAQNLVVADSLGRIGWTIAGAIPRREGFDGSTPESWADGSRSWSGWLQENERPRIVDPPSGLIWTANARTVGGPALKLLGEGGYALGARARQIRDALRANARPDEVAMLALQLDDRALFLERWKDMLIEILDPQAIAADPRRAAMRAVLDRWDGRASIGSAAYRIVRAFRINATLQVLRPLVPAGSGDERPIDPVLEQSEGPVWKLVTGRPAHMLDPRFPGWKEALLAAADSVLESAGRETRDLADWTWGRRNRVRIRHPFSSAFPWLGSWLDMPSEPLPGDSHMPRVQSTGAGASQRMVVSPGRESEGIFHMPGGQSGHLASPHYRDGHAGWAHGTPQPFMPGPPVHTLVLQPVS